MTTDGWPDTLHLATSIPRLDAGGLRNLRGSSETTPTRALLCSMCGSG